jgi:hypothetical protein
MASLEVRTKALAARIRTKINEIMPRLQPIGGAGGQVLTKNSAADFDSSWQTPSGGGGGSTNVDGGNATSIPASNIDGGTATA